MSPAVFVPVIVVGVVAFNAIVWFFLWQWIKKNRAIRLAALNEELARLGRDGEKVVCGPVNTSIRTGHGQRNYTAALTSKRFLAIGGGGRRLDVPLSAVTGVRADGWFNSAKRGGHTWLIVQHGEAPFGVGLRTDGHQQWLAAIETVIGQRATG